MARFPAHKLSYKTQDQFWMDFCLVLSRLRTGENIHRFLKDLFNRQERMMFVRRLQIAKCLEQGMTYAEIRRKLHVSSTTIGRVQRWLEFGREGYKRAIKELLSVERLR